MNALHVARNPRRVIRSLLALWLVDRLSPVNSIGIIIGRWVDTRVVARVDGLRFIRGFSHGPSVPRVDRVDAGADRG